MKIIIFVALVLALSLVGNLLRWGYDDTDDKRPGEMFGKRSGLSLYTDHATGVQYIKGGLFGGTTPRLDKDGKPIIAE
jgi:hypothetical protein